MSTPKKDSGTNEGLRQEIEELRSRLGEAEQTLVTARELRGAPGFPRIEYLYGQILAQKGDLRGAAERLRAYLELEPESPEAAQIRAAVEQLEGRLRGGSQPKD